VPDIVLIAHGSLPDQKECQQDLVLNQEVLQLNGISPILFAEAFAGHMEKSNNGKLAIIGSVAGDRGRKSNYVYGSAKGLVTRYVQGLQHRLAGSNVKVVLIKPGPTDTPMTAEIKGKGVKLANVTTVAKSIVNGIENTVSTVYAPGKWLIIMMIIKHLPRFVFNKMDI
jgi:decaprenylphospho-beta-D-erythro-pentofuranosid-2-ulose 2-reductase